MTEQLRNEYLMVAADLERWMYELGCSIRTLRQIAGRSKAFGSIRLVAMSKGSVTLIHSGNLLDLNEQDRQFIGNIMAEADRYESARELAGTDNRDSADSKNEGKGE